MAVYFYILFKITTCMKGAIHVSREMKLVEVRNQQVTLQYMVSFLE
jgi:hypothetical protein